MNIDKLNRATTHQAGVVCNSVLKRAKGKTPKIKDYPAMIVACGLKQNSKDYSVETSRSCQNYKYEDVILRELEKLGKIDGRSNIKNCDNRVGHCAEPHAANELARRHNSVKIEDFEFGVAIRPRTLQPKSYCENCKHTFPQLNKHK